MSTFAKRFFAAVLAVALILAFVPASSVAYADVTDEADEASYSIDMRWIFQEGLYAEYSKGELMIYKDGRGLMEDYDNKEHPWEDYSKFVKKLSIYGDLEYVGNEAFAGLVNLKEVYIRGDIEKFGKNIFRDCPSDMEVTLVVNSKEKMSQDNETWLKLEECLKGTDIGCYILYEDEADIAIGDDECEGTCEVVDDMTSQEQPDSVYATGSSTLDGSAYNALTNKKNGKKITAQDLTGMTCCAYYTGKEIKLNIKISGLKKDKDYKITYKNNKNVGQAQVTIKGKGAYTGTINAFFNIKPKGTVLKSVKVSGKSLKINWKRQSLKMADNRITGYQVQLAQNKTFTKGVKSYKIKEYKNTSYKISGLKAGTRYYVRVRTYVKTKGSTYYSRWSKAKNRKIR